MRGSRPREARGAERRATQAASTIRTTGSGPLDVMVLDVSATGIRIVTPAPLEIGQEISIGLAGAGVTTAFVVRREGDRYGCAFEAPIGTSEAALAFSQPSIVRLGQREQVEVAVSSSSLGSADLRELYRQHRFLQLPPDAVFVIIGYAVLAAYLCWTYIA